MDFKRARFYYMRKDIQNVLLGMSKNREVVPRYGEGFGKRPDSIEYANDISGLVEKGATSFHCSEELWRNPLDLKTDLTQEQANELRIGWDLILDIDSKFLEYSKIATELVIESLKFHNIHNVGLKFSGNKGWHIALGYEAFPKTLNELNVKDFFPDGPRLISSYLNDLIRKKLSERILELNSVKEISERLQRPVGDFYDKDEFNPFMVVDIDTILISPRHLFRMPYSLNEKSGLSSIVIYPDQIKNFHPGWAKPDRVLPKRFIPEPEKNEAKELLLQALDWKKHAKQKFIERQGDKRELIVKDASPEFYPPCIKYILEGMKHDGRKRALFILLNFLKSVSLSDEDIAKKIDEWNKLNFKPLKQGYIISQLSWFSKNRTMLPPNCDKSYYKDIAVCHPDFFCPKIKNPVKYVSEKLRIQNQNNQPKGRRKKK
jgi:DNA primase catalytic subunit